MKAVPEKILCVSSVATPNLGKTESFSVPGINKQLSDASVETDTQVWNNILVRICLIAIGTVLLVIYGAF
jgi:hypothetical protein